MPQHMSSDWEMKAWSLELNFWFRLAVAQGVEVMWSKGPQGRYSAGRKGPWSLIIKSMLSHCNHCCFPNTHSWFKNFVFISSHKWRTNVQQTWSLGTVISLNPSHWEQLSISYAYTAESVSEGTQSETIWNRERERNWMDQSNIWCTDLKKKHTNFCIVVAFL